MTNKHYSKTCWIITEGIAGTENQCIGVAEKLRLDTKIMCTSLRQPWKTFSPYLGVEQKWSFEPQIEPPYPDLLITSGRKSIAASRYIKRRSDGKTITVHIQDPRISPKYFDMVAVPEHDPMRGSNVLVTKASPNRITAERLRKAMLDFPELGNMPSPRVAVLIGGNSKAYNMSRAITKKLARDLCTLDASLMITCSRRTGEENQHILEAHLKNDKNYFWNGSGNNPYMAILGWADYILVTADSASMISESCTTGRPVYMIELDGGSKRILSFHKNLINYGALKKFKGVLNPFTYEPLNDAQMVADEIKKRFDFLFE